MNTQSNSNNYHDNPVGVASSCHLFEKFLVRYPGSQKNAINLILGEKVDRISLYSKLLDKLNIYENFDLNVHLLKDIMNSGASIEKGLSFIIASGKELDNFKKIDTQSLFISKHAISDRNNIGYQRHVCPIPTKPSVSLGEYKHSTDLADALIRKAQSIFFNLDVIRVQDSFSSQSNITGLNIYEACSISRSAGLSSGLQLFSINIGEGELTSGTEELVSLMFWYFLEGSMDQHIDDIPENNITYLVESDLSEEAVEFIKSKITGRWSFKHPEDGKLYPCTENDYNELIQGSIPDIILALK